MIISGETFGRSGYGIGLQKNSFWTENVTLQILGMHESGFMESLDNKWILKSDKECEKETENFPTTLGLRNMAGVFILVGAGIVAGFVLITVEIYYKRKKNQRLRQIALARNAAHKWITIVRNRKRMRCPTSVVTNEMYKPVSPPGLPRPLSSASMPPIAPVLRSTTPPPLPFKRSSRDSRDTVDRSRIQEFQKSNFRINNPLPFTVTRGMNESMGKNMGTFGGAGLNPVQSMSQYQMTRTNQTRFPGYGWQNAPQQPGFPSSVSVQNFMDYPDMEIPPPPPPPTVTSPRRTKNNQNFAPYFRGNKGYFAV